MSRTATVTIAKHTGPSAAKKPKKLTKAELARRKLAEELIGIEKDNVATFAKMADLKAQLKEAATTFGASFKEDFTGVGSVIVSRAKPKTFKGNVPEIVPEAFNALSKKDQAKLVKAGLVREVESYTGTYYGAVEVKLF